MTPRLAFKELEAVARAHANGSTFDQVQRIEQALTSLRPLVNSRSQPPSRPPTPSVKTTPAQPNQLDLL